MSMKNRTSFSRHQSCDDDVLFRHCQPDGGQITVLDRMTGFGYRDIETGYRCPSGQFWLASGGYDIRNHLDELDSDDDMAEWVKGRANNCTGRNHPKQSGVSYNWLMGQANWKPTPTKEGQPTT